MKFSSSSSASTPYNGVSLQNSNDAAAGCLSGIFRRFLCGNLSVRYFNHSKETDREDTESCQHGVAEEKIKPSYGGENQDFILLCFGSDGGENPTMSESKELKSEMGFSEELKADMGFGELKEKRRESCKSKAKERKKESRAKKKERGRDRRPSSRKIIPEMRIESNSIETAIAMPSSKREIYKKPRSKSLRNHKEIAEIMKLTKKKKRGYFG